MKAFLAATVLGVMTLTTSAWADARDFGVINQTGYAIKFLAVSEAHDNDFSENELTGVLANGGKAMVHFTHADKGCSWKMKATSTDGTNVFFPVMNLCTINNVTIRYNKANDTVSFTTD
jgi:hypothetical protein